MQRLGSVPEDQSPPNVFSFRFVETDLFKIESFVGNYLQELAYKGTIFIEPSGTKSRVTICLTATRYEPEIVHRTRNLMKRIIVEMNPPELVMRHEGVVLKVDAKGFLLELPPCPKCGAPLMLSEDRSMAKCSYCGSMHPTIKQI